MKSELDKSSQPELRSLSQTLKVQLIWLGIALFLASFVLIVFFSWRTIEITSNQLTNLQAESIIRNIKNNPNVVLPQSEQEQVFSSWDLIPVSIRGGLKLTDVVESQVVELKRVAEKNKLKYVYLLYKNDKQLGDLFFVSQHSEKEIDSFASKIIESSINDALVITLLIFGLLFFLIRWLLYRTSQPLQQLSHWSKALQASDKIIPMTSFSIKEADLIASQLASNLNRIEDFNSREQAFLKHASHEFRTPLAIIQASLDTLNLTHEGNSSVNRALRASENMNRLSTSLLWLARESNKTIRKEETNVNLLVNDSLSNLRYLIENKQVEVQTELSVETILIEKELISIVINNLIRNAFENCFEGRILISVSNNHFEVSNTFSDDDSVAGFGLGLELTEKICNKFNWKFQFEKEPLKVTASVAWRRT